MRLALVVMLLTSCGRDANSPLGVLPGATAFSDLGGLCDGAWCWENPRPFGYDVRAMSGGLSGLVLGTREGRILVQQGTAWRLAVAPAAVTDIHGGLACAGAALVDLDGRVVDRYVGDCTSVSVAGGHVWVVAGGDVWRDGLLAWGHGPRAARAVLARPGDVWVVGELGLVLHDGGNGWEQTTAPTDTIESSGPSTSSDVFHDLDLVAEVDGALWAAGACGVVVRYDGAAWSRAIGWSCGWRAQDDIRYAAIVGGGGAPVWAAGADHYDQAFALYQDIPVLYALPSPTAAPVELTAPVTAGWSGGGAVWLAAGPQLFAWDGAHFGPRVTDGSIDPAAELAVARVLVTGDDNAWAVGERQRAQVSWEDVVDGFVAHRDATGWRVVATVPAQDWKQGFVDAAASPTGDVWAVGAGVAMHWDGSAWSQPPIPAGAAPAAVIARGPREAWMAAGRAGVLRWDGKRWSTAWRPSGPVTALADAGGELWAAWSPAAYAVQVVRGDGRSWTIVDAPAGIATAVRLWAGGSEDVWLHGSYGADQHLVRWNGMAWLDVTPPGFSRLAGGDPGDLWAVVGGASLARWNGASWSPVATPIPATWASGERGHFWIGDGIRILRLAR